MTQTRITAACPEAMLDDANQLAMALGRSEADGRTYGGLGWQDAQGNLYAAASFEAPDEWIAAAQSTLVRPAWDVWVEGDGYIINMTGAERAQAAMTYWTAPAPDPETGLTPDSPVPQASPTALVCVGGMKGPEALEAMGLTRVPSEI